MKPKKINVRELMLAIEDGEYIGACLSCGEIIDGIEPDARDCECESCGMPRVYGAEEILLMGVA